MIVTPEATHPLVATVAGGRERAVALLVASAFRRKFPSLVIIG